MSEKLHAHEYANLFPLASSNELDEMAQDIKKRGLLNPIVMLDGLILDGRNRYEACRMSAVEPSFTQYTGTDPLGDVLSWNLHRRQLNTAQRAALALELKPLFEKQAKERMESGVNQYSPKANLPQGEKIGQSRDQAAAAVGISGRTVQDAETIRRESQETFEKVKSGEITVNAAKRIIREKAIDPLSSGKPEPKLDADSDNETIMGLRRYWRKATKKEKASFLAWVNKGTKEGTKE